MPMIPEFDEEIHEPREVMTQVSNFAWYDITDCLPPADELVFVATEQEEEDEPVLFLAMRDGFTGDFVLNPMDEPVEGVYSWAFPFDIAQMPDPRNFGNGVRKSRMPFYFN